MSSRLHHVVMCSHSADDFLGFLTGVIGMTIQERFQVPSDMLETTWGWPPSSGAQVTLVGSGDHGLIEVLDVPESLREVVPEGLAALTFMPHDVGRIRERANASPHDVKSIDTGVPGSEMFICTVGGVPMGFMGGYPDGIEPGRDNAANS